MKKRAILLIFCLAIFYPLIIFAAFPNKVVENVKSAVVALYVDKYLTGFRASGFFIDSSGTIITAKHAVAGYPRLWARLYDGRKLELILAGFQENDDLAIMFPKISENEIFVSPYLKFNDNTNLAVGQSIMAVGSSLSGLWQTLYGNIKNLHRRMVIEYDSIPKKEFNSMIEYNLLIPKGFSGGPLVDENGDVLGVNIAATKTDSDENLSYAISIEELYRNSPELIKKFPRDS